MALILTLLCGRVLLFPIYSFFAIPVQWSESHVCFMVDMNVRYEWRQMHVSLSQWVFIFLLLFLKFFILFLCFKFCLCSKDLV